MTGGWIDVHHHLLPPPLVDVMDAAGMVEVAGRELPEWSPQLSLEVMDRQGIDTALLSVSATGVHFCDDAEARWLARACNEYGAELVADHPGRFGYFASLPLPDLDGSLAEVEHALDVLGAEGFVLQSSNSDGSYVGDARFDPLMAELDRRAALVFVHPAIPRTPMPTPIPAFAMEFPFDTTRAAFNLAYSGALERYPHITCILSHAGGTVPYLASRFSLLWLVDPELAERAPQGAVAYLARLYYDTALSANPHALSSLVELVGWDHVVFGSDFPFAPELAAQLSIASLEGDGRFDAESLELVRRRNALGLLAGTSGRFAHSQLSSRRPIARSRTVGTTFIRRRRPGQTFHH